MNEKVHALYKVYTSLIKDDIRKLEGYSIFADESMNMRKIRIKDSIKDDLKYKFFVLGGVEIPVMCNIDGLKNYFQDDDFPKEELKYKYISYGSSDFKKTLKSKRLNILLKYLISNRIYIHFSVLNYWYWAIADIVDSLIGKYPESIFVSNYLKMGMYEALMKEYDETYSIFVEYDFPSIPHGQEQDFLIKIKNILSKVLGNSIKKGDEEYDAVHSLIKLIDVRLPYIKSLTFIQDEEPRKIVNSLSGEYIHRACLYYRNGITFDREDSIENDINSISPDATNDLHCSFVDSKDCFALQVSDVIAGFVARLFQFISNNKEVDLFYNTLKIGSIEFENIHLFKQIWDLSTDFYKLNFRGILSSHQNNTLIRFLEIIDYFYYLTPNKLL